jgi:hypothetical protein
MEYVLGPKCCHSNEEMVTGTLSPQPNHWGPYGRPPEIDGDVTWFLEEEREVPELPPLQPYPVASRVLVCYKR